MVYVYLRHKVKDFDTWKPFFDNEYASRKNYGIEVKKLFRSVSDRNEVHVLFSSPSEESVMQMISRPELKDLMKNAGVVSEPEISILELTL
jgi:hypothetical protein